MKRISILLSIFFAFIFLSCVLNNSKDSDEKKFAIKVFESVQKNSYKDFHKLVITPGEFLKVLSTTTTFSEEEKNNIKEKLTQEFLDKKSKETFDEIQSQAKEYGLDLSKVKIDSVFTEVKEKEGLNALHFKVYFNKDADTYYIGGRKIIKTEHGWKIADNVRLRKVNKD